MWALVQARGFGCFCIGPWDVSGISNLKQEQVELSWPHLGAPGVAQSLVLYTLNPFILIHLNLLIFLLINFNFFSWRHNTFIKSCEWCCSLKPLRKSSLNLLCSDVRGVTGTRFPCSVLGHHNPARNFLLPRCGEAAEPKICQGQTCKLWFKNDNCAHKTSSELWRKAGLCAGNRMCLFSGQEFSACVSDWFLIAINRALCVCARLPGLVLDFKHLSCHATWISSWFLSSYLIQHRAKGVFFLL